MPDIKLCEVLGCNEQREAYCHTAQHDVCKKHHDLFHWKNGDPLPDSKIPKLKWKVEGHA